MTKHFLHVSALEGLGWRLQAKTQLHRWDKRGLNDKSRIGKIFGHLCLAIFWPRMQCRSRVSALVHTSINNYEHLEPDIDRDDESALF